MLFLFAVLCALPMSGESFGDNELDKLVNQVIKLRINNQSPSREAANAFAEDPLWTMMTELGEGLLPGEVRSDAFMLNFILQNADNKRNPDETQKTHGDFLSGAEPHYYYSLMERAVEAGKKVEYSNDDMKGRSGTQYFVIVLLDPKAVTSFNASVKFSNEEHKFEADKENGILKVKCDAKSETFSLTVDNTSDVDQSFVVINYNTRDK